MANQNMKLVLSLAGRDDGAGRLLAETERQLKRAALSRNQLARAGKPYELAGIRSERAIQREILQTQAAFRRLARSGTASQNDLARAAVATKNRIRELNAELQQGIQTQSRFSQGMNVAAKGGAALMAGGMAAYSVLKPAMDNQKQLDANVAQVAWQAYGEDDSKSAQWIASQGKTNIRDLALSLVESNGGTHDAALQLINSMMANGMSFDETKSNAQASHKAMIASSEGLGDYNAADTAKLFKVLSDFGFKGNDLGKAFEYAMKSGMQGNFEIADMVRELPALLPAAKSAGMDGLQGFAFLLSGLQSAANKAGSNNEAANNMRNLLEKTLSADTTKRLSEMANPNQPGKGIDWQGSVLQAKASGESAPQVLGRLASEMLEKDAEYQSYKKKADAGDETAKSQMNIMKGFVLSSILPDIQAKAGLLAASDLEQINGYMQGLMGLDPNASLVDKKLEVLQQGAGFKQEQAESEAALKQDVSAIIEAETALKQLTAEYPNATLAVQTLTAAAIAASAALGAMSLLGGKGLPGAGKLPGGGGAAGSVVKSGGKWLPRVGGALVAGLGIYNGYQIEQRADLNRQQKNAAQVKNVGESGGALAGGWAGAKLGAAIGTAIAPGVGTAIGGVLGGLLGGAAGYYGGGSLADGLNGAGERARAKRHEPLPQSPRPAPLPAGSPPPLLALPGNQPQEKMQPLMLQQTADFRASMAENSALVGNRLDAINSTLAGQQQVIQNNMTVTLDGRVIANEVSRYQYAMFGRGVGQ